MKLKSVSPSALWSWPMALMAALTWSEPMHLAQAQAIETTGDVSPLPPAPPVGQWRVGGSLYVGRTGMGTLTIRNGAVVDGANGIIGEEVGSEGIATVTGTGSSWSSLGRLTVGERGAGRLTIQDQAQVASGTGLLGDWESGSGEVLVSGAGSRWDLEFDIDVGTSGIGLLNIQNGGVVLSDYARLGFDSKSHGTVVVSGEGSAFINTSDLTVGDGGIGELQVKDGGLVRNRSTMLGAFFESKGTGLVSGQGAVWESQALSVGVGGEGILQIRDGGRLSVLGNGVELARFSSGSGAIYIGAASTHPVDAVAVGTLDASQLRFGEGRGTLNFNHTDSGYVFGAAMSSGRAGVHQINHYAGTTRLTGDSSGFQGETNVQGGTLIVAQQLGGTALVSAGQLQVNGSFGGPVSVTQAGVLAGAGTVNGAVVFSNGGALAGVQGQTLAIAGPLHLDSASQVNVGLGALPTAALFRVDGDLVLDGTLHVSDLGGFGAGIYRLFDYGGALTNRGLEMGASPLDVLSKQLHIQTAVAGQVNLVSSVGAQLSIWDGGNLALHDNGVVNGGSGQWRADGENWTEADGLLNGPFYQPNMGFAIFEAAAGTVTVDRTAGAIGVTGMQFASDGYRIEGDAIDLEGAGGVSLVRVGDGSAAGARMRATVNAPLNGVSKLVKTDLGNLVLGGRNTYSGGTRIDSGVLVVSSDANLGAAATGVELNGGTLATTASFDTNRPLTLSAAAGRVQVASNTELGLMGSIGGSGGLVKQGLGALRLDYVGSQYSGVTAIEQGRLLAGAANVLSQASIHTVAASAVLDLAGHNQTIAALNNSGSVMLSGAASSQPGTTLKLTGPYVGHGGSLSLSAKLQGPGSVSDLVLLSGSNAVASGSTSLVIRNVGGLGAQTDAKGIAVVATENGGSLTPGAFTLAGGHVDVGAFEYRLKSDASGASLHSSVNGTEASYRSEVSLLSALPAQLRQADLTMLGNRYLRAGEEVDGGADSGHDRQAWGRLIRSEPRISQRGVLSAQSQAVLTGFQAGVDVWAGGGWTGGLYVGQLSGDMQVQGFAGGQQGQDVGFNSLRNRYLGVYGRYQNAQNLYLDAVLQAADYRSDLYTRRDARAVTEGHGWLASLEAGLPLALQHGWQLEPQAQLIYRRMYLDDTSLGVTSVRSRAAGDWLFRLGARIQGNFSTSMGVLQPFMHVNLFHASRAVDVVSFMTSSMATAIEANDGHTSTEVAMGGTWKLSHMTSIYAELGKLWANGGAARVKTGVQATLGVRRRW